VSIEQKTPIFEVNNLNLTLKGQDILTDISLKIFSSEYIAIIGPNGGGKTTLVKMLLGLDKPTSGEIKIFGKKLKNFKEWYKIGYVPQRVSLVDTSFPASVEDVVKMGRISQQKLFSFKSSEEDKHIIKEVMQTMDVYDLKHKMVGTLSGGQRQRVMIARALASKPEILILDEPNTGVDVVSQQKFYKLLAKLNREKKITIVFITHDIGVIADDIKRLFTINQKAVICNDPKKILSCDEISKIYGVKSHLLHNHQHEH